MEMMNYSQAVQAGCRIVRAQLKASGHATPVHAQIVRAARKVLRDDGTPNPHPILLGGLVEGIHTWWDEDWFYEEGV